MEQKNVNLNMHGNVSKKEEMLHLAYSDLITFGKMFSPQDFLASATPQFHNEVGKLLIDREVQQLALVLSLGLERHKTKQSTIFNG